eukprot:TRINITY_DN19643_c0_g2_i2.p1 TRINITY_DN19643_c0_g2~~TRINITY_DN19643_c0_g2_i2.p1  ORF type:complete len:114 (+),score=6.33 TRINITY_DN19643_c0_g2_i2:67-408(+)
MCKAVVTVHNMQCNKTVFHSQRDNLQRPKLITRASNMHLTCENQSICKTMIKQLFHFSFYPTSTLFQIISLHLNVTESLQNPLEINLHWRCNISKLETCFNAIFAIFKWNFST